MDSQDIKETIGVDDDGCYRINPETGEVEKESLLGWDSTGTRINPNNGHVETRGLLGLSWDSTGTRINPDNGHVETQDLLGLSWDSTDTRINPDDGHVETRGLLGLSWDSTNTRVNPHNGNLEKQGFLGLWWNRNRDTKQKNTPDTISDDGHIESISESQPHPPMMDDADSSRYSGKRSRGIRWISILAVIGGVWFWKSNMFNIATKDSSKNFIDWRSPPKLDLKGLGTIRIGMTPAQIEAQATPLKREANQSGDCYYVTPASAPGGLALMIVNGRLARIDITSPEYSTLSGARVGYSQLDVIKIYSAKLQISQHQYTDNGRYLTYVSSNLEDQPFRMVFETDGVRVTQFRVGKLPEVEYVEGCY